MATRLNTLKQQRIEAKAAAAKLVDEHLEVATKENRGFAPEEKAGQETATARVSQLDELIAAEEHRLELAIKDAEAAEAAAPGQAQPGAPAIVKAVNDKDRFKTFGEQLQAVRLAGTPEGVRDPRLMAAATGLNETVPSEGGFLVQQEFAETIWERTYQIGELIRRASRQPISKGNGIKIPAVDETSRADGSRYGGVQVFWTEEAGLKVPSKPAFRQLDLKLKKLAGLIYMTDELLEDAPALEAFIRRIMPEEMRFTVENAFVNGTGAGQPLGYMNSGAVVTVTRQVANEVHYEDMVAMWSRMWAPSRSNAVWLMSQNVEPQLYTMSLTVGTGGAPVYLPAGGVSQSPFATLFGRPIIPSEYTASLGTTGDVQLVDMGQYVYIDKGGIKTDVSMHVRFIYDESVFRFVWRIDGQPEWNTAVTPRNGGAALSPFVVLGSA